MAAFTASDWSKYRVLTIVNTSVPATMPDGGESGFPVDLIIDVANSINDDTADLATTFFDAYVDTGDLCFTANPPGANTLPHGIKRVITTNGSEYLAAAVYVASISSSVDTTIRMYYGSALGDQQQKTAVYPTADNWQAYWSLEEAAAGAGGGAIYLDWTSNANDGEDYVSDTGKGGQVGLGQEFDADDYIDTPLPISSLANFTLSAWMKHPTPAAGYGWLFGEDASGAFLFGKQGAANACYSYIDGLSPGGAVVWGAAQNLFDGGWHFVTLAYNGSQLIFYGDDNTAETSNQTGTPNAGTNIRIAGRRIGEYWNEHIDEARISSVARSENWHLTQYNCQNANNAFWAVGAEQAATNSYENVSGLDIIFALDELIAATSRSASGFDAIFSPDGLARTAASSASGFDIIFDLYGLTTETFLRLYLEGYPVDKLLTGTPLAKLLEGYPVIEKLRGKPTS